MAEKQPLTNENDVISPPARRPRFLRRLAVFAWLTWLASAVLLWIEDYNRALHPAAVPFVILLAVTLLAGVVGVVAGLWRAIRGPRRLMAAGWALAAILPAVAWGG